MSQENRVVTVTINPVIDQTISLPNFTPGAVNRVQASQLDAGGKGINVASCLCDYGHPTTVTGFLGADNDEIFRRFFRRKGIEDRFVTIAGQTRTGIKIIDELAHQTTDINFPGQTPGLADIEQLFSILKELAVGAEWFVLSGSIPPGVPPSIYHDMIKALADRKVVVDTSGEGFRQALLARPTIVKPNLFELEEFAGRYLETPEAILAQARAIGEQYGIRTVIVSLGKEGAIFLDGEEIIWAVPDPIQVKSTVGAGDAMVAGVVAGKLRGLASPNCARLATAFAMNALTHIGSGLSSVQAVQAMMARVTLRDLPDVAFRRARLSDS
jgi:1-phosphofructokinase family hexose kinase